MHHIALTIQKPQHALHPLSFIGTIWTGSKPFSEVVLLLLKAWLRHS